LEQVLIVSSSIFGGLRNLTDNVERLVHDLPAIRKGQGPDEVDCEVDECRDVVDTALRPVSLIPPTEDAVVKGKLVAGVADLLCLELGDDGPE
jgi:hypothetical protein